MRPVMWTLRCDECGAHMQFDVEHDYEAICPTCRRVRERSLEAPDVLEWSDPVRDIAVLRVARSVPWKMTSV